MPSLLLQGLLTTAGLTGVMAASQSTSTTNMPRIDNFCWGP